MRRIGFKTRDARRERRAHRARCRRRRSSRAWSSSPAPVRSPTDGRRRRRRRAPAAGATCSATRAAVSGLAARRCSAVVRQFDGRGPATLLTELVLDHMRAVASPTELIHEIYDRDLHRARDCGSCGARAARSRRWRRGRRRHPHPRRRGTGDRGRIGDLAAGNARRVVSDDPCRRHLPWRAVAGRGRERRGCSKWRRAARCASSTSSLRSAPSGWRSQRRRGVVTVPSYI